MRKTARAARLLGLGSATTVGVATVGWWWVTSDPVKTLGQAFTEAGRLAGLASGVAVICLIALAARFGPLDRAVGSEHLYRWHSSLGGYAVWMVLAHAVLITAGYAMTAHETIGAAIASFAEDPPMMMSILALGVVFVIGAASIVAVRRKLPYEVWHAIHLATYAAILLGMVHQVTNGAQFVDHPVASGLWTLAWLVPVLTLIVNRLIRPVLMNARHRFRIDAVLPEADGVYSVVIGGIALDKIRAEAGQFIRVHANAPGLRFASNPYSLSAMPGHRWRITVGVVGEQSARLVACPRGTRLWLEGPMGGLVLGNGPARPVLLAGAGTGIAPMRALAEAVLAKRPNTPIVVWYRVRDRADALFKQEWPRLVAASHGRLVTHLLVGPRSIPGNSITAARIKDIAPWVAGADVFACGPPGLTRELTDAARTTGAASVTTESFGW